MFDANRLDFPKPIKLYHPDHFLFRSWARLYRSRFPLQELAPLSTIANSMRAGQSYISGLLSSDHREWVAFTSVESYKQGFLLAYLATAPDYEGLGFARELVEQQVSNCLSSESPFFFLEATPKLWPFYENMGWYHLPFDYAIPEFYGDGVEKMGLFMKVDSSVQSVSVEALKSFVSELFLKGYGLEVSDKRYILQMARLNELSNDVFKIPDGE